MVAVTILAASALTGCQGSKPASAEDAKARVEAALQIGSPAERDAALAAACRGAASVGAGTAVKLGLPRIGPPSLRDDVAEDCALKLSAAGKSGDATEVAKLIGSPDKRDAVLKKLASGS